MVYQSLAVLIILRTGLGTFISYINIITTVQWEHIPCLFVLQALLGKFKRYCVSSVCQSIKIEDFQGWVIVRIYISKDNLTGWLPYPFIMSLLLLCNREMSYLTLLTSNSVPRLNEYNFWSIIILWYAFCTSISALACQVKSELFHWQSKRDNSLCIVVTCLAWL